MTISAIGNRYNLGYFIKMRKIQSPQFAYIESQLKTENEIKQFARIQSEKLGLQAISISQTEAILIQFIASLIKPNKIVEIGTLTGLSSLYFLDLLPKNGKLWTFEKSIQHAELASQGLISEIEKGRCEIIVGDALVKLTEIEKKGPFDIIFIDGNKSAYYNYWKWAEKNISLNGIVIIDNVFLAGAVWGDQTQQKFNSKQIESVQKMTSEILENNNFKSTFIPTVEGLLIAQKID